MSPRARRWSSDAEKMKAYRARKKTGGSTLRLVVFLLNRGWRSRPIWEVISRLELVSKSLREESKENHPCVTIREDWREFCGPRTKTARPVVLHPARQPFYEFYRLFDFKVIPHDPQGYKLKRIFNRELWQRWVVPVSDGLRCTPYHCESLAELPKERSTRLFPTGKQIDRAGCGLCGLTYVTLAEANVLSDKGENILWRPDFPNLIMDRLKRLPHSGSHKLRKSMLSEDCQLAIALSQEFNPKMWLRQEDRDVILPSTVGLRARVFPAEGLKPQRCPVPECNELLVDWDPKSGRYRSAPHVCKKEPLKPEVVRLDLGKLEVKVSRLELVS